MRRCLIFLVCVALGSSGCVQPPPAPITIEDQSVIAEHRLFVPRTVDGLEMCISDYARESYLERATLNLTIDPNGRVRTILLNRSDRMANAETSQCAAALRAVTASWRYRPFLRDGVAAQAYIDENILIAPPVRWRAPRRAFPAVTDLREVRVTLRRWAGLGYCADGGLAGYQIELTGDGVAKFNGSRMVGSVERPREVEEEHRGAVDSRAFASLIGAFRRADFFSMKDEYGVGWTDLPGYEITLQVAGQEAQVKDTFGEAGGAPPQLKLLSNEIDIVGGTGQWVTASCLRAFARRLERP